MVLSSVLLGGCSGLGNFLGDTETLPGANPNGTTGVSENLRRAEGQAAVGDPILPQQGNVWPGPPQPLPTLSDVSRNGGLGADSNALGGNLPSGGSMSMGEQSAIHGGAALDQDSFSGGTAAAGGRGALSGSVADPTAHFRSTHPELNNSQTTGSDIIIPNGDGTNTIISADGSVKTVKATPK